MPNTLHEVYGVDIDNQIAPWNTQHLRLLKSGTQRPGQGLPLYSLQQQVKAVDALDADDRRACGSQHAHMLERHSSETLAQACRPAGSLLQSLTLADGVGPR